MERRRARWAAAAVVAVLMTATLSACPKGKGDDDNDAPVRGGVLRVGLVRPDSLDPVKADTVDELFLADQLFESLTSWEPATMAVRPGLATRWKATPDQQHWDFFLRSDAKTAGSDAPLTSTDVKYSLERAARRDGSSTVADLLEGVTGYQAFVEGSAPELAGVTAPAPDVVHIDLDRPWADLPSALGSPAFSIVTKAVVEAVAPEPVFAERPRGSGPFRIDDTPPTADTLRLVPASAKAALLARVDVRFFADKKAAYEAFRSGGLDWAPVPPEESGAAGDEYGRSGMVPFVAELFYGLNLTSPKLGDVRFREAIVRAIDRERIATQVYRGSVEPLDRILVGGLAGRRSAEGCGERCAHDPARARTLISEVFPDGPPPLTIDHDDDPTQAAVAESIRADLAAVGVTAERRGRPLPDYQQFAVTGEAEVFRMGWIAAYPAADAIMTPLFGSGSASNLVRLAQPKVDDALQAAAREPSAAKRADQFATAESAVLEQIPVIPIAQFTFNSVLGTRVRGLAVTATGSFDASKVWLARA